MRLLLDILGKVGKSVSFRAWRTMDVAAKSYLTNGEARKLGMRVPRLFLFFAVTSGKSDPCSASHIQERCE